MHCYSGSAGPRVSPHQVAVSMTAFIFAFAFQMLNKVSDVSGFLCPPPPGAPRRRRPPAPAVSQRPSGALRAPEAAGLGRGRGAHPLPLPRVRR